ncbi:ATP-binding protein [Kiloniella sp. b19]|uniref:ATP-binding protein n=1 Tax=Kiloniella sp. GXU_MW_B19 TaxID=3141326 RepID=UPI0031D8C13B
MHDSSASPKATNHLNIVPSPPVSFQRVLATTLVLSSPAIVVLFLMVLSGMLPWLAGLGAGLLIFSGLSYILYSHFQHIEDLKLFITALRHVKGHDRLPLPPAGAGSILFPEINPSLLRMAQERQQYRRELELAIEGNEAILKSLPDPLLMLGSKRRIVRANPAAEELFGSQIYGRELSGILRNPDLLEAVNEMDAQPGANPRMVRFTIYGNVEYSFEARVVRLSETTWDGIRILISLTDQTASKRVEQMRGDFIANASHELKTPLASLTGFIETLKGPARDDEDARERFLDIMQDQAERMSHLVGDLLSLSQIELLEHTKPTSATLLDGVVQNISDGLHTQLEAKNMAISIQLDSMVPVEGEAEELRQVFQNLMENAVKYGREGTTVTVKSKLYGEGSHGMRRLGRPSLAISVTDQGDGIPREHIPRLTERFYRVDPARSRELGGTGLGLAIVKHILNRHRGVMTIDSEVGRGSTFTVYLPQANMVKGAQSELF